MQLQPDTLLQGRYRVAALIAQGGMGAVYRAVDERLGNTVALKQTLMSDPDLRAAFEREARLLAGLQHPALPVVSDHFSEGGGQFLVMQFIPGDDLAQLLRRRGGPFPPGEALPWAERILDALDYLHGQRPPIIHRDIKPQNLKLTARGEVVLLDFGLAKGQAGGAGAGTSPSLFGYTPQYAPLEQIQGSGTDARSDLYALGATLYELLTGAPPPDALTRAAAVVRGEPDPLPPALALNPQLDPRLSHILGQALALNAGLRPPSAAAMRSALSGAAQAARAQAQPAGAQGGPAAGSSSQGQPGVIYGAAATGATIAVAPGPGAAGPLAQTARRRAGKLLIALGSAATLLLIALLALQMLRRPDGGGGAAPTSAGVIVGGATATPVAPPGPGASFADPVGYGAAGSYGPLRLRVLSTQRGEEAWRAMYRANQFNDPPPPGSEYFLVQIELEATGATAEIYPRLAGERRVLYAPDGVSPAPLPKALAAGEQASAWLPYLVAADEGNLVLHIDTVLSEQDIPALHMAADEGARLRTDPAIEQIDPNDLGVSHREPAPLGETAIMEDYEVTVLEQRRGPEVLAALIERYSDVARPGEGREYAMVLVQVRYIGDGSVVGWAPVGSSNIDTVPTTVADPEAAAIDHPGVYVLPEGMPELDVNLLPGGQFAGWTVVELPVGEERVAMVFSSGYDANRLNTRYFALN